VLTLLISVKLNGNVVLPVSVAGQCGANALYVTCDINTWESINE